MDAKLTGELIVKRRKDMGWSQAELADKIHVTDKAISRWETGRGMPALDSMEPLAEALGISVTELIVGRELTEEELPKEAGEQIIKSEKKGKRNIIKGVLLTLAGLAALVAVVAGVYVGYHYVSSVSPDDQRGMLEAAGEYLTQWDDEDIREPDAESMSCVASDENGDYMAMLFSDAGGGYSLCVYERDKVFRNRWYASGGTTYIDAGKFGSWGYYSPKKEAVLIFYGGDLPEDAQYYTFRNAGVSMIVPVDETVLDIFIFTEDGDVNGYPILLDENQNALYEEDAGLLEAIRYFSK